MTLNRRQFLYYSLAAAGPLLLVACGGDDEAAAPDNPTASGAATTPAGATPAATATAAESASGRIALSPTPACGDEDEPTPELTEGPYFTPNSPQRASLLESGIDGTTLVVDGFVVSTACQPVAQALVDFWQCDAAGEYDNSGYRLRGHQFTDADGRFRLETIVPGIYPGRTRHIHVKVQAPGRPVLTTQLFFPDEPQNQGDGIFRDVLVLGNYRDENGGKAGDFSFVLAV